MQQQRHAKRRVAPLATLPLLLLLLLLLCKTMVRQHYWRAALLLCQVLGNAMLLACWMQMPATNRVTPMY